MQLYVIKANGEGNFNTEPDCQSFAKFLNLPAVLSGSSLTHTHMHMYTVASSNRSIYITNIILLSNQYIHLYMYMYMYITVPAYMCTCRNKD